MTRRRERTASWRHWWAQAAEARPIASERETRAARDHHARKHRQRDAGPRAEIRGPVALKHRRTDPMRQRSNQARSGVSLARTKSCSRHEEANHEQGYGQEEGSEEETGKVSAGEARGEEREETEPRISGLRGSRPCSTGPIGGDPWRGRPRAPPQKRHIGQGRQPSRVCVFERSRGRVASRALCHYLG